MIIIAVCMKYLVTRLRSGAAAEMRDSFTTNGASRRQLTDERINDIPMH